MKAELADFLHYCRVERRLADLTCTAYECDVKACLRFLEAEGFTDWAAIRPPDLRRFLAAEAERRPALGSQARTVAALKVFFRFCVENEYLERDPALVLRTPKKREALPDVLDSRELARLLRVVERDDVWQRHVLGEQGEHQPVATPACARASYSGSTGTTSTWNGASSACARGADARLVASYLGHADLSTVSRYAHVAADELYLAADALAVTARFDASVTRPRVAKR